MTCAKNPGDVLREYNVDNHLLLAVKLLYSCWEVVSVSVELNYNHSSLVWDFDFDVCFHNSFSCSISQPSQCGINVGSYRFNHLVFADNLVLLARIFARSSRCDSPQISAQLWNSSSS